MLLARSLCRRWRRLPLWYARRVPPLSTRRGGSVGKSADVGTSLLQVPTTWFFGCLVGSALRRTSYKSIPALPLHPTAFYKRLAKISERCDAGLTNYSACERLRQAFTWCAKGPRGLPRQRGRKTQISSYSVRDMPAGASPPRYACRGFPAASLGIFIKKIFVNSLYARNSYGIIE